MSNANFLNKLAQLREQQAPRPPRDSALSGFRQDLNDAGTFFLIKLPFWVLVACGTVKIISWICGGIAAFLKVYWFHLLFFGGGALGICLATWLVIIILREVSQTQAKDISLTDFVFGFIFGRLL